MEMRKPRIYLDLHTETGFCTADYHIEGWEDPGYEGDEPYGETMFEGESCVECLTKMLQSDKFQAMPANAQWYYYLEALRRNFPQEEDERAERFSRTDKYDFFVPKFEAEQAKFLKRIGSDLADMVIDLEKNNGRKETIDEIKDSVAGSQIQNAFYQSLQEYAANRIS